MLSTTRIRENSNFSQLYILKQESRYGIEHPNPSMLSLAGAHLFPFLGCAVYHELLEHDILNRLG